MASPATSAVETKEQPSRMPLLENGDHLSRAEFERRYERMPNVRKAELIEGIVYIPSPVRADTHGIPHQLLSWWLGCYAAETPGVECADNATVRLDGDNEPQPDLILFRAKNGEASISPDDYVEGAPELVVEIVESSRAYDLHQKKNAYRRNGCGSIWRGSRASAAWCGGGCATRSMWKSIPKQMAF